MQVAVLVGQGAVGRAILDTLQHEMHEGPTNDGDLGPLYGAFGQMQHLLAWIDRIATTNQRSPEHLRYLRHVPYLMVGLPRAELATDERRFWETERSDSVCGAGQPRCRATLFLPSMAYALRVPRTWWPYRDRPSGFRFLAGYALATRDTQWIRIAKEDADSIARVRRDAGEDDQGMAVVAADTYLAFGDSVNALRIARVFVDTVMTSIARMTTGMYEGTGILFVPRMMLQRADLADALGHPDEARTWYARVIDLWANADPELQPTVARIRARLGTLGPSKR